MRSIGDLIGITTSSDFEQEAGDTQPLPIRAGSRVLRLVGAHTPVEAADEPEHPLQFLMSDKAEASEQPDQRDPLARADKDKAIKDFGLQPDDVFASERVRDNLRAGLLSNRPS